MSELDARRREERVLMLAPTPKDAVLGQRVLVEAGVVCTICSRVSDLCRELQTGASVAVLTEESLADGGDEQLAETLRGQPAWSDLPVLLLTGGGANSPVALHALQTLGNVTLLERPLRVTTLVSAVHAALRARRRQYQVRDHLAERDRTAAALREADGRKDEFLAMLGHELRNPLAPIRNALQVLRLRCGGDAVAEQMGGMMERQVTHMVRLIDDLLDVSRIARGKVELRQERVNLARIVARAVEGVRSAVEERQHRLEVVLADAELWLEADPVRLEQVLANLLTNACKYTRPGGRIQLAAENASGEIVIRVRDNGIGVRPELLNWIFEKFAQADRVPGRLIEGLGLGLSLVKNLVEMHDGTVSVFSEGHDCGSEFVIRLPAAAPPDVPSSAAAAVATGALPLRVLVVDDNVDGAESLALVLKLAGGHEVRVAYDGPTALAEARAFQPAAVLLDIGLPLGMDGYEVARRLRREAGLQETFVVAVTGYGQAEDLRRSREAGINVHLVKPVVPEVVQQLLAEVAGRQR